MKINTTAKLSDHSKIALAKAIFNRLIDVDSEKAIYDMLRDFIVGSLLPKRILLPIIRLLLVYLDRGYNRTQSLLPPCEDASREDEDSPEEEKRNAASGDVNDVGRRQRASWITTICLDHLISRWRDRRIDPEDLLTDDGLAPRPISLRGRQTIVMHMVESFITWTNVVTGNNASMCTECKGHDGRWPCPPKVLNLCTEHGNWSGTRVALAAISSSLKAAEKADIEINKSLETCSKCGVSTRHSSTTPELATGQSKQNSSKCDDQLIKPVIKLDVVLMGSIQDWVVDVLLYVLRNSSAKGFDIEISAIRSEDLALERLREVLDNLSVPEKVQSLEFRTRDPKSIFSAAKSLRRLTGLESFIFAHLWRHSKCRTKFTTDESCLLSEEILGRWTQISKIRFEGIVPFSDYSSNLFGSEDIPYALTNFLPRSLRFVEFAHHSLSTENLQWMLYLCGGTRIKSQKTVDINGNCENTARNIICRNAHCFLRNIHTLRFDNETLLGSSGKAWGMCVSLLSFLRVSLRTLVLDHCEMTESQCVSLHSAIVESPSCAKNKELHGQGYKYNSYNYQLPLQHITIRETGLTASATFSLFDSFCAAAQHRILPQLSYFASLLPSKDDPFWTDKKATLEKGNEVNCLFENRLQQISKSHGCSHITVEAFWEPSESEF